MLYKMKLAAAADIELIAAARKLTKAKIRIDANEAWTLEDARTILPQIAELDVELIEQPLHREDKEGMTVLKSLTNIPIIADEACQSIKDLAEVATYYDGINVKLAKCSGITPALDLIKEAKNDGLKIMLGCMSEGVVGCTAMSHLLPLADYADIDGPLILSDPTFRGMQIDADGSIAQPTGVGLGLKPLEM
jgi:L-alanine-DL-glutamate epimerase-like enolase superfamily enzyme